MKNLTKLFLGAASLVGLLGGASVPVLAQDAAAPAPDFALTGYVAVTSDYRFRGISQSDRSFAPQGSLNLTGPDGFYVGTWASTIDFDPSNSSNPYVEVDIYGGKHTDLWGFDWNIEPYYYSYPSADIPAGAPKPDYFELINQVSHPLGPVAFTATWAWSPNLAFNGGTGNYIAGTASMPILDWLSISGNVGHQWAAAAKTVGSRDYTYADFGATATWHNFALDVRYSGTDLGGVQCSSFYMATRNACIGTVVGTLTYNVSLLP